MAPPPTPKTPPKNPAAPPSAVVASIRNAAESIQVISRRGPRTGPRDNTPLGCGRSTCFKRFARITGPTRWLGCRWETGRASAFAPGVGGFRSSFRNRPTASRAPRAKSHSGTFWKSENYFGETY